MKLSKIRIQNFRSFDDEKIDLSSLTSFVGPNGAGKSNVLTALNIFFRYQTPSLPADWVLGEEDFHHKNVKKPIVITLTFTDMPEEAKKDFAAYFRNGELTISARATWDKDQAGAPVEQRGARLVFGAFRKFFKMFDEGASATDLKEAYAELKAKYAELPSATSKQAMKDALRAYEESHPKDCELSESGDQFYGWSKGANLLAKYVQWVYVPAVKDAASEQDEDKNTALGTLLARTIRTKVNFEEPLKALKDKTETEYKKILATQQGVLSGLSASLAQRLQDWSKPGTRVELNWHYDDKSIAVDEPFARAWVGEGSFLGEIPRLGHGVQRTFIVALLQELALGEDGKGGPSLILGFEEPELYQHPPQARHLAHVLEDLAAKGSQVIVTTHSPYFILTAQYEGLRRTSREKTDGPSTVKALSFDKIKARLSAALPGDHMTPTSVMAAIEQIMQPSQNELFFSTVPILVEGSEDIGFISTHLHLSGQWREFRKLGCHFIQTAGKDAMSRPLAIACELAIPSFAVFDSDIKQAAGGADAEHKKDNTCLFALAGAKVPSTFSATHFSDRVAMLAPTLRDAVKAELGQEWDKAEVVARKKTGLQEGVREKHPLVIAATLEELWAKSIRSKLLDELCALILKYAKTAAN